MLSVNSVPFLSWFGTRTRKEIIPECLATRRRESIQTEPWWRASIYQEVEGRGSLDYRYPSAHGAPGGKLHVQKAGGTGLLSASPGGLQWKGARAAWEVRWVTGFSHGIAQSGQVERGAGHSAFALNR